MMLLPMIGGFMSTMAAAAPALQLGFTAASAISSIAAGNAKASAAKYEASMAASEERLQGESEALKLKSQLNQTLGQSLVAYAASGTDTVGSPSAMGQWQTDQTDEQIAMTRRTAQIRAMQARIRGQQAATSAKAEGLAGAIGTLGNYAGSLVNRG